MVGMAMLLGAVYVYTALDSGRLDMVLGVSGVCLVAVGLAVNHLIVKYRISKRGYFRW